MDRNGNAFVSSPLLNMVKKILAIRCGTRLVNIIRVLPIRADSSKVKIHSEVVAGQRYASALDLTLRLQTQGDQRFPPIVPLPAPVPAVVTLKGVPITGLLPPQSIDGGTMALATRLAVSSSRKMKC